jgi:acetolactate synthase-1/2/3 large subunit
VLYVGGGVIRGEATQQLMDLAELTGIPVVTTLMARGAFPDSHPQNLGMPGMHGTVAAVAALQKSDLLIALGTRFDDRVTGKLDSFAPEAKVIHADIDPAEIGKNRNADVPIVGDVKAVIGDLIEALRHYGVGAGSIKIDKWWEYLSATRSTYPLSYGPQSDGSLSPEYVIETLGRIAGPEALYVAGVGQHQMWAAQFISYENPRTWLNSGGLGTMGFAIPAAMGAKFARPEAEVWAIDGDGCFQMTNQELATCTVEGAPIKVAIINNGNLGMVRQWQTLFYEERYSQTGLGTHGGERVPDFVKLAEAYGCVGLRCERAEDVEDVINQARAINDRPVVIDFIVGADAQVWPMVAAGMSNDEIQAAKGIRPLFDDSENEGHA